MKKRDFRKYFFSILYSTFFVIPFAEIHDSFTIFTNKLHLMCAVNKFNYGSAQPEYVEKM